MAVSLFLHLFGKPGHELNEGEEVSAQELRSLAQDLHSRLLEAANIVEKLTGSGWEAQMALYDIILCNPYVETASHAEEKLHDLGIDPDRVSIEEWPDEEDDEEEEDEGELS